MATEIDIILRGPKAFEWARETLAAMEANNVWPTAINFELWMYYVAAKDSQIAAEIEQVLKSGARFTEQVGEEIASKHLPSAKLNGEIMDAGRNLSAELDTVSRAIETARETSEAYGQQLASASISLEDKDAENVRSMVETLSAATLKVREENQVLESQLADTTSELSRLRENLEQVRRDAMTDALTMLFNRKAFDQALEKACQEAAEQRGIVTLAVIDIDHFKIFNDTWGHQTGDQVIRYVASVIGRMAEGARIAARYGGEEFALIFPGEDRYAALSVIERAREEISTRILRRRSTNEQLGAITISSGIAEAMHGGQPAALIERADGALYVSKRNGRNRTTLAEKNSESQAA
ncbi:MAG: GGDEF domain-containing protein [Alphaproteobacteria bacterium]|jgi:diguanylate cyclase